MKVNEIITSIIIEKLKSGIIPWYRPWSGNSARNWVTQKPYSGINRWLLDDGEYLTFKQVQQYKGKIKKGAKTHICVFYKPIDIVDSEGNDTGEKSFVLRYYNLFHINDVDGIQSKYLNQTKENYSIEKCQAVIDNYINRENVKFEVVTGSGKAYYSPSEDKIVLPGIGQFDNSEFYYATAFHEMAHSTGHKSRLNRFKGTKNAAFGSKEYSKEELVAEIASASICSICDIDSNKLLDNATAYIGSWLTKLENDNNFILSASARAEKAMELILQ